jgi:hypothetical protein
MRGRIVSYRGRSFYSSGTISVTGPAKARIVSDYIVRDASVASEAGAPEAALPQPNR